jgi:hypothetical protein
MDDLKGLAQFEYFYFFEVSDDKTQISQRETTHSFFKSWLGSKDDKEAKDGNRCEIARICTEFPQKRKD